MNGLEPPESSGAKPLGETAYHKMISHLGESFSRSGDDLKDFEGYSLFKDISDVKRRYESMSLVGSGGMKRIYKASDRLTGRDVAFAIMRNISGKELVEQFVHEARLTARLEHPNIMPIYDIGIDEGGEPFFTMKFIRGESLGKILRRLREGDAKAKARYPLETLLDIFMKVCDAVSYAHSNGVLHLDLKPDNVQVGGFGEALVCDWGLSRYREAIVKPGPDGSLPGSGITLLGSIHGSPGYMSPEQITRKRKDLDFSSDIYSLGCILYEILSYCPPIEQGPLKDVLKATVEGSILHIGFACGEDGASRELPR